MMSISLCLRRAQENVVFGHVRISSPFAISANNLLLYACDASALLFLSSPKNTPQKIKIYTHIYTYIYILQKKNQGEEG